MMPFMVRALGLVAAAVCAVSALGSPALVEAQDRARLHFEAGASYYEAGDYEDALREFTRSYELSHEPKLFYNFSLCHAQLGRYEQAAEDLERYLQQVAEIENRGNLERRLINLRERADDEDGGGGDARPEDEVEEEDETSGGLSISPVAIAGFAAAGAGAVMLGVFGGLALGEQSDLDADPCAETRTCDASGLRTKAILADVGLGLLVAGAVVGTVFLFIGGDEDDDEDGATARWSVSPAVSRDGAAISAQGVF